MLVSGNLRKMVTELSGGVKYQLPLDEARIDLNALSNTAGLANGAATYNATDETAILNQLIANGNLVI